MIRKLIPKLQIVKTKMNYPNGAWAYCKNCLTIYLGSGLLQNWKLKDERKSDGWRSCTAPFQVSPSSSSSQRLVRTTAKCNCRPFNRRYGIFLSLFQFLCILNSTDIPVEFYFRFTEIVLTPSSRISVNYVT